MEAPPVIGPSISMWEYKTICVGTYVGESCIDFDTADFDSELNQMGAAGWELVAAFETRREGGRDAIAIFKRPRRA